MNVPVRTAAMVQRESAEATEVSNLIGELKLTFDTAIRRDILPNPRLRNEKGRVLELAKDRPDAATAVELRKVIGVFQRYAAASDVELRNLAFNGIIDPARLVRRQLERPLAPPVAQIPIGTVLAGLAARGITVRLGSHDKLFATPAALLTEKDLGMLRERKTDLVLALNDTVSVA